MAQNTALQLHVEKSVPVPVARLYQAWISPDELTQWWHPMGNNMQRATTNPAPGAPVEYVFANETGAQSFTITGTYKEVAEAQRLVYTWNWQLPTAAVGNSEYLLTIEFRNEGSSSRLVVTQENFASEEAVHPHREGWEKALNDLHQYLSPTA